VRAAIIHFGFSPFQKTNSSETERVLQTATGLAGHSSAKPESLQGNFLKSLAHRMGEGGRRPGEGMV
jgi:hypothetical protein